MRAKSGINGLNAVLSEMMRLSNCASAAGTDVIKRNARHIRPLDVNCYAAEASEGLSGGYLELGCSSRKKDTGPWLARGACSGRAPSVDQALERRHAGGSRGLLERLSRVRQSHVRGLVHEPLSQCRGAFDWRGDGIPDRVPAPNDCEPLAGAGGRRVQQLPG